MCTEINVWDQILLVEFEKFSLNLSWKFKFGFGGSEQSASKFSRICRKKSFAVIAIYHFLLPQSLYTINTNYLFGKSEGNGLSPCYV